MVEFLVAHHLTLSHIAQRRDIDDPKTIADLAATAGDPQRLKMLYLLTWADMRAVGPGVLTPWQASILHELYRRALVRLTGGRAERPSRVQLAERLRAAAGDEQIGPGGQGAPGDDVGPLRGDDRGAADGRAPPDAPAPRQTPVVTELFHHTDLGSSDLVVVTRDLPGLFCADRRHAQPRRA